jgi:hypothetical protein
MVTNGTKATADFTLSKTLPTHTQSCKLDTENHPAVSSLPLMEQTGTQSGKIQLQTGENYWLTNIAAEGSVVFAGGFWEIKLQTLNLTELSVKVGEWNTAIITFYEFTTVGSQVEKNGSLFIQTSQGIISGGDYLALQVNNSGETRLVDCTDETSFLTSPDSTPRYPVPELPA